MMRERAMRERTLLKDQRAATAIEYGLIAALIALACIIAFQTLGLNLETIFTTINDALNR
jgi:pilus assembly protein Flp/PilA